MVIQEGRKMKTIVKFLKDEEGLTTVEYAVAGTLISLAIIASFTQLSGTVDNSISSITDAID